MIEREGVQRSEGLIFQALESKCEEFHPQLRDDSRVQARLQT